MSGYVACVGEYDPGSIQKARLGQGRDKKNHGAQIGMLESHLDQSTSLEALPPNH